MCRPGFQEVSILPPTSRRAQVLRPFSIVFTSWRSTLDILGDMLSQRGIASLRIDGRVNSVDRTAILSEFHEDPKVPVLLLTIGSGAVGYDAYPNMPLAFHILW